MTDRNTVQQRIHEMEEEIEKQKQQLRKNDRELQELKKRLGDSRMNQSFGLRYDDLREALEKVYGIISCLDKYTREEVLFYAAQVLSEVMDCRDVAIYTVANRDYARLFSATSPEARKLGNSIKYTAMGELYEALTSRNVYMNEAMTEDFPMMASAIYAGEEMIQVIVMFWGIPGERMNQSEVKRLTVVETLLQNAVLRATCYMAGFRKQRYLEGTNVLNEEAFQTVLKAYFDAKAKGLTECALLEVMMGYQDCETVSLDVACNIRQTDYLGMLNGGKLYILLANTDSKNAGIVQERLRKLGYDSQIKEEEPGD